LTNEYHLVIIINDQGIDILTRQSEELFRTCQIKQEGL